MADAEHAAGERVDGRDVGAAVVGDQLLDGDAVAGEVSHRSAQEADRGGRLLVVEDFDVGQAGGVVDRDVDELPADRPAAAALGVGAVGRVAALARRAVPGPAADAPELLDVDVDQLARALALVADRGLLSESAEL